jgi:hypothetical protein
MAARAAAMMLVLTLLCGGCALFSGTRPEARQQPTVMPLTADNVAQVRASVARVKATAQRPGSRDEYVRFARAVYVASWSGSWSVAATTETALAKAKAGNEPARDYLTVMVYDIQLQAAMEGASLTVEDWRDIYVGSGIMTAAAFSGYASMSLGGKVLP